MIEVGRLFLEPVFLNFNGELKSSHFGGSAGHGIRLWFPLVGVIFDCHFLRPRQAIEMIEMIEMIEVIFWGGGWRCASLGGPGRGVELEIC